MKNIKSEKIYNTIKIALLTFVLMFVSNNVRANVYDYDYSLGVSFTTSKILGDNPAINTLAPINTPNVGGGINGAMPGFEIKGQYKLDGIGDWRLVAGANYTFLSAKERIPRDKSVYRLSHTVEVLSPLIGLNYYIFRFPNAMSSIYAGLELRYNYIHGSNYQVAEEFKESGEVKTRSLFGKPNAGRVGGIIKLGIEGELYENYMINVSWGVDALNILGRDNNRGQLLTPFSKNDLKIGVDLENQEDFTYNFYFSLMIQYRFN